MQFLHASLELILKYCSRIHSVHASTIGSLKECIEMESNAKLVKLIKRQIGIEK